MNLTLQRRRFWIILALAIPLTGIFAAGFLDAQCLAGKVAWTRLTPSAATSGRRAVAPVRTAPIALLERRRLPLWMALARPASEIRPSPKAEAALESLTKLGALFFDELAEAARLLRPQLEEALALGVDTILLDNMKPDTLRRAIEMAKGKAVLEASGNVTLSTVRAIAETGVDYISSGAITHSAPNLDVGLDF